MIDFNEIFNEFPILQTDNLLLTLPDIEKHSKEIFSLLNEQDIKENYLNPNEKVENLNDIHNYILNIHECFRTKKAITWAIIEKKSGYLIGLRDLYFDSPYEPVEGQGCISKEFRKKGFSKECYNLFFDYFKSFGVSEYTAKCNGKSIAPLKLLYSMGFQTADLAYIHPSFMNNYYSGWSIKFHKNISREQQEIDTILSKNVGKKLNFFVAIFLRPYSIEFTNQHLWFDIKLKTLYSNKEFHFLYDRKSIITPNTGHEKPFILNDDIMKMYEYFIEKLSSPILD